MSNCNAFNYGSAGVGDSVDLETEVTGILPVANGGTGLSSGVSRAIWAYQDFTAGSISSTSVTLTANENGTSAPFSAGIVQSGRAFIVTAADEEEYAYSGTTKLFSTKIKINSMSGVNITLNAVPHPNWGNLRIWYKVTSTSYPENYTEPGKIISSSMLDKLDPVLLTEDEIGVDVQAYSARLTDIAALSASDGNFIVGNGTTWVAESGATARNSLGLGSGDSPAFTGLNLSGLTASQLVATDGSKNLQTLTTATYPSLTEISYVKGVTSAVQTQIDNKQPLDSTLSALATYNTNGILVQTAADTFAGRTITGTTDKITITNGDGVSGNPTITIASTYAGQNTITTLGTIATGVWQGTPINLSSYASGTLQAAQFPALTGDITTTTGSLATTLATVNSNIGTFGSATKVAQITANAKGLITGVIEVTISGVAPGGSAGGDLSGTYPNPTVAKINGATLGTTTATSGNILIGSGTAWVSNAMSGDITIDSSGVAAIGANKVTNAMLRQSSGLSVLGRSANTTGNVADITAANDNEVLRRSGTSIGFGAINLASSNAVTGILPNTNTTAASTNTASAIVTRDVSGNFSAGTITAALSGNATTATTLATGRTISITGDLSYTSPSFDGSGNVTAAGTLATVNSNVGSFGSATQTGTFTVNGKGLITAASSVTITPAVGSITGLGTGVATALGVNVGSAGAFVVNGGALGTPSSGTLTSCTGLPISTGVSGLGTGIATFLATPSSANLAAAVTDETGSGALVFATSPTISALTATGQTLVTYYSSGRNIEFGNTTDIVYMDFHSKDSTVTDFDARILCQGGNGSSGGGTLTITCSTLNLSATIGSGTWQGTKIGLAYGGTNADLSATGGTSQVLRQSSSGAAITVSQLAASDLSNGTSGSGAVALVNSPSFTTPSLGTATASSINTTNINNATEIDFVIGGVLGTTIAYVNSSGLTMNNGTLTALNAGFKIMNPAVTYGTTISVTDAITANRTLSFTTGNANRTITLSGNPTLADWFDQSVKTTSAVTFGSLISSGFMATNAPSGAAGACFVGDISGANWVTCLGGYQLTFLNDFNSGSLGTGNVTYNATTFYPKVRFNYDGTITGSYLSLYNSGGTATFTPTSSGVGVNTSFGVKTNTPFRQIHSLVTGSTLLSTTNVLSPHQQIIADATGNYNDRHVFLSAHRSSSTDNTGAYCLMDINDSNTSQWDYWAFGRRGYGGSCTIGYVSNNNNYAYCISNPFFMLSTSGALRLNAYGAGTLVTDGSGNVTASSDERLKTNIQTCDYGLSEIRNLHKEKAMISYSWKDSEDQSTYIGFSAQRVYKVIPEAAKIDSKGYHGFSERPIIAALVNATQEVDEKIIALQAQNLDLIKRIEQLESKLIN